MTYNKYHVSAKEERTLDGIIFDSKKEMVRYKELTCMDTLNLITNLKRQVKFEVIPATEWSKPTYYIADFVYFDRSLNKEVIEDSKGIRTAVFNRKWKIMQKRYPQYLFLLS